ncbi:MAG TPA: thioesterase family protein [Bryobacteraceae bacterium]|jgi:YbgC/YbaW family acyl-CoA thioester hydrolase|nr:thioesterase family protein [Bryobacteraceae bacterium]
MPQALFSWQTRVRFSDTDASGRIHYTAMLRFFEAAETEFLRSLGFPYGSLESETASYPRVHVECTYKSAVRDDDLVNIAVAVERAGKTSFTLGFSARVRAEIAAYGRITIVCMDRKSQRSQPLSEEFSRCLRDYAARTAA